MRSLLVAKRFGSKGFFVFSARPLNSSVVRHVAYRSEGWWLKDHKPTKFPRNEDERRAAAVKYGLRDEDYKTCPPDEIVHGNYPDLGWVTWGHKDPFENWTDQKYRRNYGEPVPIGFLAWTPDRNTDTGIEWFTGSYGGWQAWAIFIATAVVMFSATHYMFYQCDFLYSHDVMPVQYPYDYDRAGLFEDPRRYPLKYYTFESAE